MTEVATSTMPECLATFADKVAIALFAVTLTPSLLWPVLGYAQLLTLLLITPWPG